MAYDRVFGFVARALDDAGDLMPEREGQRAPSGHVEFFVAAEGEVAIL